MGLTTLGLTEAVGTGLAAVSRRSVLRLAFVQMPIVVLKHKSRRTCQVGALVQYKSRYQICILSTHPSILPPPRRLGT